MLQASSFWGAVPQTLQPSWEGSRGSQKTPHTFSNTHLLLEGRGHQAPQLREAAVDAVTAPLLDDLREISEQTGENHSHLTGTAHRSKAPQVLWKGPKVCECFWGEKGERRNADWRGDPR